MNSSIKNSFYLAGLLLLSACGKSNQQPTEQPVQNADFIAVSAEQQKLAGITFGQVTKQWVEQTLACSGVVDVPPANRISLSTVYGGYITFTGVYPGDKVSKGQLLARLQDPMYIDLQRSYLEGLSNMEYLKADYERKAELNKTESISEKQLQLAKRDYESNKVEVSALAAQLKMAGFTPSAIEKNGVQQEVEIRSPINGFVTDVSINQGMHLAEGQQLFELLDPSHVHIELSVFPSDLPKLAEGQTVHYRISGSKEVHTGRIKLINKAVGSSKSIMVHVHPAEEDEGAILPGTFIQAEIVIAKQEAPVLPLAAVNQTENGYIAYKQVEGGVEAVYFTPRFVTGNYVDAEILKGAAYLLSGAEKLISLDDEEGHDH
jgi:cobalt-zinc-cadmium efflux system membrane fusion protein